MGTHTNALHRVCIKMKKSLSSVLLLLTFLVAVVALPADSIVPEATDTSTDQAVEMITKLAHTLSLEQRTAVLASLGSTAQASGTDWKKDALKFKADLQKCKS